MYARTQVAEALAFDDVFQGLRQAHAKEIGGGQGIPADVFQDSIGCHGASVEEGRLRKGFWNVNRRFLCRFGEQKD